MDKKDIITQSNKLSSNPEPKTNEKAGVSIQGHLKIYDPNSKEVFVSKRA